MIDVILFCFMVIMIAAAIGCVYVVWIATICTWEIIKEWYEEDGTKRLFGKNRN